MRKKKKQMRDLFDPDSEETILKRSPRQLVRNSDPVTSLKAAMRMIPKLKKLQRKVYDALWWAGVRGLTDYELEERLGSHGSTYRTRRSELVECGLAEDSGRKRIIHGSLRVVWVLAYIPTQARI